MKQMSYILFALSIFLTFSCRSEAQEVANSVFGNGGGLTLEFRMCRHTTARDRMGREFFPVVRSVS